MGGGKQGNFFWEGVAFSYAGNKKKTAAVQNLRQNIWGGIVKKILKNQNFAFLLHPFGLSIVFSRKSPYFLRKIFNQLNPTVL